MATYNTSPDLESDIRENKDIAHDESVGDGYHEPVEWSFTRIIAVAALCIAYVGMFLYFQASHTSGFHCKKKILWWIFC